MAKIINNSADWGKLVSLIDFRTIAGWLMMDSFPCRVLYPTALRVLILLFLQAASISHSAHAFITLIYYTPNVPSIVTSSDATRPAHLHMHPSSHSRYLLSVSSENENEMIFLQVTQTNQVCNIAVFSKCCFNKKYTKFLLN